MKRIKIHSNSIYRLIIDYVPNRLGLDYLPGPDDAAKSVGCVGKGQLVHGMCIVRK